MKRPAEQPFSENGLDAGKRRVAPGAAGPGSSQRMGMKLLFTAAEARTIQGQDGATVKTLENLTGTRVKVSAEGIWYPGTKLQQLTILGGSCEAVLNAVLLAISQLASASGAVTGGEADVEPDGARLRLLVPHEVGMGLHEECIEQLRLPRGVHLRVLPIVIPPGEITELTEQVVCISGSLTTVRTALQCLGQLVAALAAKPWFGRWAGHSHCGLQIPGLVLIESGEAEAWPQPWEEAALGGGRPQPWDEAALSGGRPQRWDEAAIGGGRPQRWDEAAIGGGRPQRWDEAALGGGRPQRWDEAALGGGQPQPWDEAALGEMEAYAQGGAFIPGELSAPWEASMPAPPQEMQAGLPPGTISLKLLLVSEEVAVVRGTARAGEIQHATGTELRFSNEGECYPGTNLEEFRMLGPSAAAVSRACGEVLAAIMEARGTLGTGGPALEPGAAHAHLVIPSKATSAVIGPGGQVVARIRASTQLHVHVETTTIPLGGHADLSEQVISFDGPVEGIQPAIAMIAEILEQFAAEPWFSAWAMSSNAGMELPGLVLFQDVKGKGKGKAKGKGKEAWGGAPPGLTRMAMEGLLTLKLLLAPQEASCLLGRGGAAVKEIGQLTNTRMNLSSREQFYPGTQLQELVIKGASHEGVLSAAMHTLERITELSGGVSAGEGKVEPGGCRLKIVVPSHCASAIIGPGGSFVKSMRECSRMHIHVEETTIPPGPANELTDQVVSMGGVLEGARAALAMLLEAVARYTNEPWFEAWSANSHCGMVIPGLVLFSDKGKGKGKFEGEAMALYTDGKGGKCRAAGGKKGGKAEDPWAARPRPRGFGKGDVEVGMMCLKVLVSQEEVAVLSADASTMAEIQQATGTSGILSEKHYPGTSLLELTIQGPSAEAVLEAVLLIFRRVVEVMGAVRCGELGVPPGDARLKLVVPTRAAAAIIGPGGQNVKQLKATAGLHVHVDTNSIPCAFAVSEQGVCVAGPAANISAALQNVVASVANCAQEPWFEAWASNTNTGKHIPGLVLFEAKGKGKGPVPVSAGGGPLPSWGGGQAAVGGATGGAVGGHWSPPAGQAAGWEGQGGGAWAQQASGYWTGKGPEF